MSWMNVFGADKVVDGIVEISKEWIQTDMESAQAKTVMVKALDPNGRMRKQISLDVTQMYKVYLYVTLGMIFVSLLGIGDPDQVAHAVDKIVELFLPITGLFGVIVTASFGVNMSNSIKEGK